MIFDPIAILPAAIASFIAGAVWYMALGRRWAAAQGLSVAGQARQVPVGPLAICFISELIMAALLAGLISHVAPISPRTGMMVGAGCWLAFVVTTIVTNNAFHRRTLTLTVIDSGHWLLVLMIQGAVIGLLD